MWIKQCHKPPMTGNGKHTTYKNGEIGMVYRIVLSTLEGFHGENKSRSPRMNYPMLSTSNNNSQHACIWGYQKSNVENPWKIHQKNGTVSSWDHHLNGGCSSQVRTFEVVRPFRARGASGSETACEICGARGKRS